MNNTTKRKVLDSIVWSLSLLFAFGLFIDSALADTKGFSATNAAWKAERGDVDAHAVRIPR